MEAVSGGFHPVVLYLNQTMNAINPTIPLWWRIANLMQQFTFASFRHNAQFDVRYFRHAECHGEFGVFSTRLRAPIPAVAMWVLSTSSSGSYGGTLTITPTNREGSVNSALSNITMSYTHSISNYGWTSGVSNTTTALLNNYVAPGEVHIGWRQILVNVVKWLLSMLAMILAPVHTASAYSTNGEVLGARQSSTTVRILGIIHRWQLTEMEPCTSPTLMMSTTSCAMRPTPQGHGS